jgi:hypothetical protein
MKLIRLESDLPLTTSYFTDNLAVPLTLDPGASVALKNISFQFEEPKSVIKDNSYTITYNTASDNGLNQIHTAIVGKGAYTDLGLVAEIQNKMNALLVSDPSAPYAEDAYFTWNNNLIGNKNDGYQCQITFNRDDPENVVEATSDMYNMQYLTNGFTKSTTDNNKYNSAMRTKKPLNGGGYIMSFTVAPQVVGQSAVISNSLWYVTISKQVIDKDYTETEILDRSPIAIGQGTGGKYKYKTGLGMVLSTTSIENGDIVKIYKQLVDTFTTRIIYSVTKTSAPTVPILFTGPTISTTELLSIGQGEHYLHLHIGNDTGKIAFTSVTHSPDPNTTVTNGVYTKKPFTYVIKDTNKVSVNESNVEIDMSDTLSLLLGYEEEFYDLYAVAGEFKGENTMASNIWNDDIVVEIPELNLSTYDHTYKQRRNIIMAIPAGDANNSVISKGNNKYVMSWSETATFLYVPLNNKGPLQLPSLSVMVSSGGVMLPMNGKMSCLLLFKQD